jgi:hypothetical protein
MSVVNLTNVVVHNNPGSWESELQFEIEFEVLAPFDDEVEMRLTYIGSAEHGATHDQLLDSVLVGPMNPGAYKILFQADPPDISLVPAEELLGVTGLLLSCHFRAHRPHSRQPLPPAPHTRRAREASKSRRLSAPDPLPRPQARHPLCRSVTMSASTTTPPS